MLQDGVCTLFATPAESSAVLIDGKVAVYVNGCHAVIGRSGSVVLQARLSEVHPDVVLGRRRDRPRCGHRGIGLSKQVTPEAMLFRGE